MPIWFDGILSDLDFIIKPVYFKKISLQSQGFWRRARTH